MLVDNFCICEGFSVPRCLMYEIYVETCGQSAQNQVNPATFGKGSARYHYDGIYIKKSSFFYAHYCYLLGKKSCHSGDLVAFGKPPDYSNVLQQEETMSVVFLADEYCNYCRDILQNVRNQELEKESLPAWGPRVPQDVSAHGNPTGQKSYVGEMAQWLRTLAAFVEDLSLVPSSNTMAHNACNSCSGGSDAFF
ncbi:DNA-binding protein RFX8 [Apodemus speciosus]|uniref:DNA-binding protein RFX8 n=1 Tax=Apodemus speciosus TaxID=105296 RepID=A0ABQ0EDB3_APOSI